ncbi:uncharacterized protein LOC141910711 [Tubulanus polymorphus]|uniref:uncharacterized protein LOC141910711 n=1 Tax=Tubulanus polymorphus TaxID=672921 RepID=UPI003DA62CA2
MGNNDNRPTSSSSGGRAAGAGRVGSGRGRLIMNSTNRKSKIRMVDLSFQFHPEDDQNNNENKKLMQLSARTVRTGNINVKGNNRQRTGNRKLHNYHRQLRNDIDKILAADSAVEDDNDNVFINGFNSKHLQTKVEQQKEYIKLAKALLQTNRTQLSTSQSLNDIPASTYRSNTTHSYLTPTELRDQPITDLDLKLGRPTRTTLLRHRQRSNSAQLNSNQFLLEARKVSKKDVRTRPATACVSHRERRFNPDVVDGESVHSFLTGARYNRAHHFDARSLDRYGVFLPRSNPAGCFINLKPKITQSQQTEDYLLTPPDSPSSSCSDLDKAGKFPPQTAPPMQQRAGTASARLVTTARSHAGVRQVWGTEDDSMTQPGYNINHMYEQFRDSPETLNVKGTGLTCGSATTAINIPSRPKSAHKLAGVTPSMTEPVAARGLPSITGSSICLAPPTDEHRTTQERLNEAANYEQKLLEAEKERSQRREDKRSLSRENAEESEDEEQVIPQDSILVGSGVSIPRLENIKIEDEITANNRQLLTPPPNTPTDTECHTPLHFTTIDEQDLNIDDIEDEDGAAASPAAAADDDDNVRFFLTEEGGGAGEFLVTVAAEDEKLSDMGGAGDGTESLLTDHQPTDTQHADTPQADTLHNTPDKLQNKTVDTPVDTLDTPDTNRCFLGHGQCLHGDKDQDSLETAAVVNEEVINDEENDDAAAAANDEENEDSAAAASDEEENEDDLIHQPVIAVDITERPKSVEQKSVTWGDISEREQED